jgi:hypothetical protein
MASKNSLEELEDSSAIEELLRGYISFCSQKYRTLVVCYSALMTEMELGSSLLVATFGIGFDE